MSNFHRNSVMRPAGSVALQKIVRPDPSLSVVPARELTLREIMHYGFPNAKQSDEVNRWRLENCRNLWRGMRTVILARMLNIPHFYGKLSLAAIWGNGRVTDYGLASLRVVTTAGVGFIVDAFQNSVELEIMKFHGIGTGNTAEASGDTALVTELTTEYNPNSTRATGSLTEGASANIFRTVGTNTLDSGTPAVVEHGIFSAASSGVLLDRSIFSAINLVGANGDGLQSTYDLTLAAGS